MDHDQKARVTFADSAAPEDALTRKEKGVKRRIRKSISWMLNEPEDSGIPKSEETKKLRSRISEMSLTTLNCPEEGASIAFHEYTYKLKEKIILDGISGHFMAGRVTAIMGPSGSGKTSLIETMTGSNLGSSQNNIKFTDITLNGQQCTREDIAAISGFVPQDDIFLSTMKVKEAVAMSAYLRLPRTVSNLERDQRIEEVLQMFNLKKCQDTILGGDFGRGISGGEKRRVSIAREIIANPPILFLDEPTSGLDSYTSLMVVRMLKELAEQGRTVVLTIHQPGSEIFNMFDDLVLLVGGKVVYWGAAKQALRYFGRLGYECPEFANPADFLFMSVLRPVDIEGLDAGDKESGTFDTGSAQSRIKHLQELWLESPKHHRIVQRAQAPDANSYSKLTPLITKAPFFKQVTYLYGQYMRASLRSPLSVPMRVEFAIYSGLLIGLAYTTLRSAGYISQIRGRMGSLAYLATSAFLGGFMGCLQTMWEDRTVFLRDYRSHYYDVTPAFLAKMLVSLPLDFLSGVLTVLIAYYMIGLDPAFSSLLFVALMAGTVQVSGVVAGFAVGYSSTDPRGLVASSVVALLLFALFGGIFIAPPNIPGYLRWLIYLDPVYYAFTASVQIAYPSCSATASNTPEGLPCQRTAAFSLYGIDEALPPGVNFVLLFTLTMALCFAAWVSVYVNCKYRSK